MIADNVYSVQYSTYVRYKILKRRKRVQGSTGTGCLTQQRQEYHVISDNVQYCRYVTSFFNSSVGAVLVTHHTHHKDPGIVSRMIHKLVHTKQDPRNVSSYTSENKLRKLPCYIFNLIDILRPL